MEIKLTVPARAISALKLFAAEAKELRPQLKGIAMEIGSHETLLIASDGSILGVFRVASEQPNISTPIKSILPDTLLKQIKPSGQVEITVGMQDAKPFDGKGQSTQATWSRPISVAYNGVTTAGMSVNAEYPYWRKAIPAKVSGEFADFDPRYVGRIAKAYETLHGRKDTTNAGLAPNGKGSALIDLDHDDFVGALL